MLAHSFCSGMFGKGGKQRSPRYTVTQGSQNSELIMKNNRKVSQNPGSEQ